MMGQVRQVQLGDALRARVESFAEQRGITPHAIVVTAAILAVRRYTGKRSFQFPIMKTDASIPCFLPAVRPIAEILREVDTSLKGLLLCECSSRDQWPIPLGCDSEAFSSDTLTMILGQLPEFIAFVVSQEFQVVGDSPTLRTSGLTLGIEWSNDARDLPAPFDHFWLESSIAARFRSIVQRFPERIAIRSDRSTYTYQELDLQARRVAAALVEQGGRKGGRAVLALRSPEQIIPAILGTLMAGLVYVPVDPNFPKARLAFVIEHTEPDVVLISNGDQLVVEPSSAPVLMWEELSRFEPLPSCSVAQDPDAPASILYTSGSTGHPKGVVQNNRNILYHVGALTNLFRINPRDRHAVLSPFFFDGSTTDLFCTVLNGAELIPIDIRHIGLDALPGALRRQGVTLYHSTPTTYRDLVSRLNTSNSLPDIRLIILGGESVTDRDVSKFREHFHPDCLFVNGYGATETSGFVTLERVNSNWKSAGRVVPIGIPPQGVAIVLEGDDGLEAYAQGEIVVHSKHIGLGYWRDPESTARSYTDGSISGVRSYHTGDLGVRDASGHICLVGRRDRQAKIRGHRVDPSEVEAALVEIPYVERAVVKVYNDSRTATEELVAFLILRTAPESPTKYIRGALRSKIPAYMIPSSMRILDSFPLTSTGKIDVNALTFEANLSSEGPSPAQSGADLIDVVRSAWRQVLGTAEVGLDDNFFDLGGHSLLMARVHELVMRSLTEWVPIYRFFEHPTIRSIAEWLSNRKEEGVNGRPEEFARLENRMLRRRQVGKVG